MSKELSFVSDLKATGHGEVWDHTDNAKFKQFGWRCTTNESSYSNDTLIGNWNEQKFDISKMFKSKPNPSSYAHYFETTYQVGHDNCRQSQRKTQNPLKDLQEREPTSFPGHQPELDPPSLKVYYNTFTTTSRETYKPPINSESR